VLAAEAAALVLFLCAALPAVGARTGIKSQHRSGGTISWLLRHEPRGASLASAHIRLGSTVGSHWQPVRFARVLTPNPRNPDKLVVSLIGKHGRNICLTLFEHGRAVSGGCGIGSLLKPFSSMTSTDATGREDIAGLASDEVASISLVRPGGRSLPVPLKDNAFLITIDRSGGSSTLVAYDSAGSVISSTTQRPITHLPG